MTIEGEFPHARAPLTTEEFERVEAVFAEAAGSEGTLRIHALDRACADRPDLRREVEALLAAHDRLAKTSSDEDASLPRAVVGSRIGAYALAEKIGEGGMGEVYRAERVDGALVQQVAVKITRSTLLPHDLIRRFKVERQILASLHHPNIVRMLDAGATAEGQAYLVMEYVEGTPITRDCRTANRGLEQRLRLFQQVCSAVHHAHRHGIVHRDLKPANILVTHDGVPKVLDFGVAKMLASPASGANTATGALPGPLTLNYASPEQLCGQGVTTASDIYALGILLYELLAGERPYETTGQRLDRVIDLVVRAEPPRPSAGRHGAAEPLPYDRRRLRGDLDAIVLKALDKEPERRYASAEELAADIGRVLDQRPVLARGPSAMYVLGRLAARHRAAVAVGVLATAAVLVSLALAVWQRQVAERERLRSEQRSGEVRQLANALIFRIHDAIAPLPGSTPVRKTLIDEALGYLESLARESAGDAALQLELARAYARIGKVQGTPGDANLGDARGAALSYERAVRLLRPIATGAAAPVESTVTFVDILLDVSVSAATSRDPLLVAKEALGIARDLLRRAPTDWNVRRVAARANHTTAMWLNPPASFPYLQTAAELYGANLQSDVTGGDAIAAVAAVERLMGAHRSLLADFAGALPHHLRARELDEQRLRRAPHDRRAQWDLADDLVNIGEVRSRAESKDLPQAVAVYGQALRIREDIAAADPRNVYAQQSVGWVEASLARVYAELDRPAAALEILERAVAVDKRYPLRDGIGHRLTLAGAWLALGEAWLRRGLRRQACRAFQASLDDFTEAEPRLSAAMLAMPHMKKPVEQARRGVAGCAAHKQGATASPTSTAVTAF